jgi:hypothetical protein
MRALDRCTDAHPPVHRCATAGARTHTRSISFLFLPYLFTSTSKDRHS